MSTRFGALAVPGATSGELCWKVFYDREDDKYFMRPQLMFNLKKGVFISTEDILDGNTNVSVVTKFYTNNIETARENLYRIESFHRSAEHP